jgi:predicted phosphodiesterase
MKLQICSDLHLEFSENRKWLKNNPLLPKAEVLIIAGDTYYLNRNYAKLDFIKRVSDEFKSVYLIPGNHEYYEEFDVSTGLFPFELKVKDNVTLVNNKSIELENVKLIFSTFWSLIEENTIAVMRGMVDFRRIKFQSEKFNINHFNELHHKAFEFVSNEVKDNKKKVVVTHHLPSSECNVDEFKNSLLNEAFCVEKTNFISNNDIDFWIYGHSHRNKSDFSIANTKMVTNQFGYVTWNEHRAFNKEKIIEI